MRTWAAGSQSQAAGAPPTFAVRTQQEPPSAHPLHAQCRLSCSARARGAKGRGSCGRRLGLDGGAQGTWACGRWGHRCSPAERGPSVLVFAFFLRANLPRAVALGGGEGESPWRLNASPRPHTQRTRWPSDQVGGPGSPAAFSVPCKTCRQSPIFLLLVSPPQNSRFHGTRSDAVLSA